MPAPTFVSSSAGASWDTTTTPKTSGGLTTQSGDLVISVLADENDDGNENYAWSSSVAETWTEHAESTGATNGAGFLQSARAQCSSAWSSGTVSAARSAGGASKYNHVATVWRGVDTAAGWNIGNSAELSGTAPSYSFTTAAANSALLVIAVDWNARSNSSPTGRYTQVNGQNAVELAYFNNSANYTVYVFYFADVGAAGAKTIQINNISASADLIYHVVEIKGAAGGTTHALASTGTGASTGSLAVSLVQATSSTGTGSSTGSVNLLLAPGAMSATGTGASTGSINLLLAPGAISATGSGASAGSANLNATLALGATGTGQTAGSVDVTIPAGGTTHALSSTGTGLTTGSLNILETLALASTGTGQSAGSLALISTLQISSTSTGQSAGSLALNLSMPLASTGLGLSAGSVNLVILGPATTHQLAATGIGQTVGSLDLVIIEPLFSFSPPTHEEPIRVNPQGPFRVLAYHRMTYAKSLVKVGGTWSAVHVPAPEVVAGLEEGVTFFRGGYEYVIPRTVQQDLAAAGYTANLI